MQIVKDRYDYLYSNVFVPKVGGIGDPVRLGINARTSSGGLCRSHITYREIQISIYVPDGELDSTLLHEMIHAKLPRSSGHGRDFMRLATILNVSRYCTGLKESVLVKKGLTAFPWARVCPTCNKSWLYGRRPTGKLYCLACVRIYRYTEKSRLIIVRVVPGEDVVKTAAQAVAREATIWKECNG